MKKSLLTAAILLPALAVPALAEPDCSKVTGARPFWEVVKGFEDQGGQVALAKVTGHKCYEIYGRQNGKKVEIYFNPQSGDELIREED